MPTKELKTVISKFQDELRDKILVQLTDARGIFQDILTFLKDHKYEGVVKIFSTYERMVEESHDTVDLGIHNFMKAPLGKDLRRNVAYVMVVRSIMEIASNGKNVAKYITTIQGFHIDKTWIKEIAEKIIRRIDLLEKLIIKEESAKATELIKKDDSVNELYKDLIKKFNNAALTKAKLTAAQKDEAKIGFIMALKQFELAGDAIVEMAEAILFVNTGKF